MEELRKCYHQIMNLMDEIQSRHNVKIEDFINLDEEAIPEAMGDWTERDVQCWEHLLNRASTIRKAYRIVAKELHIGEFLPEIDE